MKKKTVSGIMLTILFIGTLSLSFNIQLAESESTTWTVNDDGGADFIKIQDAINAASLGDTIYVYNGTYSEHVVVNKSVSLVGEDKYTTIVDGSDTGNVINVTVNDVNITGFTVRNSGWPNSGIHLNYVANCNILNNIIANDSYGIQLYGSSNNILSENTATNNTWSIWLGFSSEYNILRRNTVTNSKNGIQLSDSNNNTLLENYVTNSEYGGFNFFSSSDNTLSRNTATNSGGGDGFGLYYSSDGNVLVENTVEDNNLGIWILESTNNVIFHNDFVNNTDQAIISDAGAYPNVWDDGYPSGGNYWSDYAGVDVKSGPNQDQPNSDDIGDIPNIISTNNTDRYPLMKTAHAYIQVGPGKAYLAIQAAIDAASPGYTILVYDGTYNEALYINKTLTLRAASSPVVNGSQSVTTNYGARDAVIFVEDATDVIIEGFDIEGKGLGTTNPKSYGVIYENSSGTVRNCIVSPNTISDLQGVAIGAWDDTSLSVVSCTIENFGRIGVFYFSGCSGGVYDSTIIGQVYGGEGDVNYGIEVEAYDFPCDIEIIRNDIYNCSNTFSPEPTWSSAGVVIDGWRAFYDLSPSTVAIKENNIQDNYYGIEVVANSLSYAHYNNIHNNREQGAVSGPDYLGNNVTFDALFNFWGHSSGPGPVGPGEGDNVSKNVDYKPWLSCYTPYTATILYIDPPTIDKQAIEESTTFEVEVVIANVTDLYGFDLKLTWNDTLLDLEAVEYQTNLDAIWSYWGISKNETGAGWYRLVAYETTAQNGFTGDAALITLTFHVKYGPCYIEENYQLSTLIHFALVKLSDPNSTPICTKVQDAKYTVHAIKPKLVIIPTDEWEHFWTMGDVNRDGYIDMIDEYLIGDAFGSHPGDDNWNPDADIIEDLEVNILDSARCGWNQGKDIWSSFGLSPQFTINKTYESIAIEVWLVNASKVYDYAFNITYNTEILDAVDVEWGDFPSGPYYHKSWHINETTGVIEISLAETAQAPPAEGDGLLVTITFHHKTIVWKDCLSWTNLLNCTIELDWWKLSLRCPELNEITGNLVDISNVEYSYTPIQGDVDFDGDVDIFDIMIVTAYYDQSQPDAYDLNCDGIIDIFDLVYVATNWG